LIQSNHLSLSIASTVAVALTSLSLDINPANAAKISQGSHSSIGVMDESSNASPQEFNLGVQGGASTGSSGDGEMDKVSHNGEDHSGNKGKAKNKKKKSK
jgi:hypothetical protein